MIVKMIKKFDEHFIVYSAIPGVILALFIGAETLLALPALTAFTGALLWYLLKNIFIIATTKYEGPPLFEAGGLTEYDSAFADRVGKAAGEAAGSAIRRSAVPGLSGRPGTFYKKDDLRGRE